MMYGYWGDHWPGMGSGMGALLMLLFWLIVVIGAVLLARWLWSRDRPTGASRALELLKERYARGEIGRDEFEQKRRDLEG